MEDDKYHETVYNKMHSNNIITKRSYYITIKSEIERFLLLV